MLLPAIWSLRDNQITKHWVLARWCIWLGVDREEGWKREKTKGWLGQCLMFPYPGLAVQCTLCVLHKKWLMSWVHAMEEAHLGICIHIELGI
jgi:hypothetical protein